MMKTPETLLSASFKMSSDSSAETPTNHPGIKPYQQEKPVRDSQVCDGHINQVRDARLRDVKYANESIRNQVLDASLSQDIP